jgi:hypothetical protein
MFIDTTQRIAQTLYFSLAGVDYLLYKGLRYLVCFILHNVYNTFQTGVDLAAETLTRSGLLSELPTDWVNSD